MKKSIDPAVATIAIVIVAAIAIGLVFMKAKGPGYKEEKGGSEAAMQEVQKTGRLYNPPADAPIPQIPKGR
jgi:hypothetical protein